MKDETDFAKKESPPQILHQLIKERKWEDAKTYIENDPEVSSAWVNTSLDEEKKMLPIHLVVTRLNVTSSTEMPYIASLIDTLVQVYPQGIRTSDEDGNYPLHIAIRLKAPSFIISRLLLPFPDAINIQGSSGTLPKQHLEEMLKKSARSFHDILIGAVVNAEVASKSTPDFEQNKNKIKFDAFTYELVNKLESSFESQKQIFTKEQDSLKRQCENLKKSLKKYEKAEQSMLATVVKAKEDSLAQNHESKAAITYLTKCLNDSDKLSMLKEKKHRKEMSALTGRLDEMKKSSDELKDKLNLAVSKSSAAGEQMTKVILQKDEQISELKSKLQKATGILHALGQSEIPDFLRMNLPDNLRNESSNIMQDDPQIQSIQTYLKEIRDSILKEKDYRDDYNTLCEDYLVVDYHKFLLSKEKEKSKTLRQGIAMLCQKSDEANKRCRDLEDSRMIDKRVTLEMGRQLYELKRYNDDLESVASEYRSCKGQLENQIQITEHVTKLYMSAKAQNKYKKFETREEFGSECMKVRW